MGKWSDNNKQEQRKHIKDVVQPFRDGEPSKEFIDIYGTKQMGISDMDAARAKRVWQDQAGMRNGDIDSPYTGGESMSFSMSEERYEEIFGKK